MYDEYQKKQINTGIHRAEASSIVICALARNVSHVIEKNKKRLEIIGEKFKNYKIVIIENDSVDGSREKLDDWSKANSNVILLDCCDIGSCKCELKKRHGYDIGSISSERFQNMATYRDRYLAYVKKHFSNYEYMLVMDFDLDGSTNIEGLYISLSYDDWDAIFINGMSTIPGTCGLIAVPYDSLAYRNENQSIDKKYNIVFLNLCMIIDNYKHCNNKLTPVKSAFNGYGLYRIKSIINCTYSNNCDSCEHICLAKCMIANNKKLFINPAWYGYFNQQGSPGGLISFIYNYGDNDR